MNSVIRNGASRRQLRHVLVVAGVFLLAGACGSSTSLVNLWKDSSISNHPLNDVLVVAIRNNPASRRIWEDALVGQLSLHRMTATPSYRLFSDAVPDTQQVMDAVAAHGYDGVIEIHKLPTEINQTYVPGYVTERPVMRFNRWTGSYQTYIRRVRQPGYTETERIVRHQIDVWSTGDDGNLVWSGTTETIDPNSSQGVGREISRLIVPELARAGVIAATTK